MSIQTIAAGDILTPSDEEARYVIALGLSTDHASDGHADLLKSAGMRLTHQREAIVKCLFGGPDRHLTAEMLFEELLATGVRTSLATVYNTLNVMFDAGLLGKVCIDGSKTYFDTNTSPHHHFYFEDTREVADIPGSCNLVGEVACPSADYDVVRTDVIVRVRRKRIPRAL